MEILIHADCDEAGAAIAARGLARTAARLWRFVDPTASVREEAVLVWCLLFSLLFAQTAEQILEEVRGGRLARDQVATQN